MQKFRPLTRLQRWLLGISLVCTASLGLPACSDDGPVAHSRTVILGFDGMDPGLAETWMAEGKLPNFQRLAQSGHYQRLGTTNPALSPVAWSSFATAGNPGEHGIFDFIRRDAGDYSPDFAIADIQPPDRHLDVFGYSIPLGEASIENRRVGEPFWVAAERAGLRASVLRVPVSFPPDPVHRMLSGMGVPDLLGTQGTYTLVTSRFTRGNDMGGRVVRVRGDIGAVDTVLEGPPHPLRASHGPLGVPLRVAPARRGAVTISVGETSFTLAPEQWSGWVPLKFGFAGLLDVRGMVRFYLVSGFPRLSLYVSPINLDPQAPAMPISSPPEYAAELADKIGPYHTLGMPEETWSLNENRISDSAYLEMVKHILAEREAMFFDTLERRDSELVISVFVQTDRVSHMFWRGLDPEHSLHEDTTGPARDAVAWIYAEADRILGRTLDALGPKDRLVVLSDHGFSSFRRAVNLNRWLADRGYLVLKPGQATSPVMFAAVDWSRSRAYALGMNGIFLNLRDREAQGMVEADEVQALKAQLIRELSDFRDPDSGEVVIAQLYDGEDVYHGDATADAPDLVVGYAPSYRASWETVLGAVPETLVYENETKWSGDHAIDPAYVPGVFFSNFHPAKPVESIADIRALIGLPAGGN